MMQKQNCMEMYEYYLRAMVRLNRDISTAEKFV